MLPSHDQYGRRLRWKRFFFTMFMALIVIPIMIGIISPIGGAIAFGITMGLIMAEMSSSRPTSQRLGN